MPGQCNLVEVVHAGTAEGTVADRKSGRLDEMDLNPEAGGKAERRAGILGDIGLEQGDSHSSGRVCHRATAARCPERNRSSPINNWYKSRALAALAGLHSAGKGAKKPARWCSAAYSPEYRRIRRRREGRLGARPSTGSVVRTGPYARLKGPKL